MLAVRGHPGETDPTVGDVAEYLLVKHHTAGELADRVEALGLLRRVGDVEDRRVVRLQLTEAGHQVLAKLTQVHLEELERLSPILGGGS
jgi:DNA-binding MarR family transcriptional regulator